MTWSAWPPPLPDRGRRGPGLSLPCQFDLAPDLCLASSEEKIGAFRLVSGEWIEAAPRIEGVGYSPIAHASTEGMWLEMAINGAALVSFDRNTSRLSVHKYKPWTDAGWTSVSVLSNMVMFTGSHGQRCFIKPGTDERLSNDAIDQACDRTEKWIIRLVEGLDGTLWGVTDTGIVAFYPNAGAYTPDSTSFDFINDLYPAVRVHPSGTVWVTANQSIFKASNTYRPKPGRGPRATVVSVLDLNSKLELVRGKTGTPEPIKLGPDRKSVSIRLFSGTYNNRKPPGYVYRIGSSAWTPIDTGSLLSLRDLKEGDYEIEFKSSGEFSPSFPTAKLSFLVAPPWYRSMPAQGAYLVLALLGLYAAIRISNRVAHKRSEELGLLVTERTHQLEEAMQRLNEETRVAATLAERNRLAGEIHDSLQQGLSGAILQLDSTICLPQIDTRVKSRLGIVRNMISFTRHEVQNAVWDKESPLLGDGELGDALQKLTSFINTEASLVKVCVIGTPRALPTEAKHHMMRIAQEATTNAVRHARASKIAISLTYEPEFLVMRIQDDGIGFDTTHALNIDHGHFGLRGIRSRAKRLDANLEIVSQSDSGTSIIVKVRS